MAGGWAGSQALDTLQIYSGASWALAPALPTARYGACGVAHPGGYLLVAGGWGAALGERGRGTLEVQRKVEVYSVARGRWKALEVGPEYRGHATGSCVLLPGPGPGSMAVLGGEVMAPDFSHQAQRSVSLLELGGPRLGATSVPGPGLAWQPALGWVGGQLLVAGGRGSGGASREVLSWGGRGQEGWEEVGVLEAARDQAAVVVLGWEWGARCARTGGRE